ncbi:hypothetical protein [Saccharomonospora iraqiensis]|uniref:hypothetical protein n=1 Tax=Saccharomonospora iraqiensis TaxID=52698 RepID=UPI0018DE5F42|nr:hypothetical protein [Saccharomonospora iraqiensis]
MTNPLDHPAGFPPVPGVDPERELDPDAVPGSKPNPPSRDKTETQGNINEWETTAIGCTPVTRAHRPHLSSGDISAHGTWDKGSCTNNYASVEIWLQEWYTDGTWRTKAYDERTVAYGGGRGRAAVARVACQDGRATDWRAVVDVDVNDEIDTSEQAVNVVRGFACRVF